MKFLAVDDVHDEESAHNEGHIEKVDDDKRSGYLVYELHQGEPIFVIRGNDALSLALMRIYQLLSEDYFDSARGASLEHLINEFKDWHTGQRPLIKLPD